IHVAVVIDILERAVIAVATLVTKNCGAVQTCLCSDIGEGCSPIVAVKKIPIAAAVSKIILHKQLQSPVPVVVEKKRRRCLPLRRKGWIRNIMKMCRTIALEKQVALPGRRHPRSCGDEEIQIAITVIVTECKAPPVG